MDQNWFYLIEQASDMSKIKLLFIIYACCLNKTTKTLNKLTNEQPSSHFFLTDPLYDIWDMLNTMQKNAFLYVAQIKKHFFLTDPLPKNVK